jgi:serine/threonine protein phosphatase PrpC
VDGQQIWRHEADGFIAVGVWTEKKHDQGEDAEPLLVHHVPTGEGIIAVFDGAGGAGAATVGRPRTGPERTHAWAGARFARALVEEWFVGTDRTVDALLGESLREHVAAGLSGLRTVGRRKIVGTMRRELPTTLAAVHYRLTAETVAWNVLWAGDSRCYLLDVNTGLHQLSRDDTESADALVLLTEDPPMTNMISADRTFRINAEPGNADLPCVLVCATDGFFGYVNTPAEFEHVLLRTLRMSITSDEWGAALAEAVRGYTGDDASLVVLAIGFDDLAHLRTHLTERAEYVLVEHARTIAAVAADDREALVRAREDSWARYRDGYERLMPVCTEGGRR